MIILVLGLGMGGWASIKTMDELSRSSSCLIDAQRCADDAADAIIVQKMLSLQRSQRRRVVAARADDDAFRVTRRHDDGLDRLRPRRHLLRTTTAPPRRLRSFSMVFSSRRFSVIGLTSCTGSSGFTGRAEVDLERLDLVTPEQRTHQRILLPSW